MSFSVNANTAKLATTITQSCIEEAWEFGTEEGGGNPYAEWYYTNKYYNLWCA